MGCDVCGCAYLISVTRICIFILINKIGHIFSLEGPVVLLKL